MWGWRMSSTTPRDSFSVRSRDSGGLDAGNRCVAPCLPWSTSSAAPEEPADGRSRPAASAVQIPPCAPGRQPGGGLDIPNSLTGCPGGFGLCSAGQCTIAFGVRLASCSGCSLLARQSTAYCPDRPRGRRLALSRALRCPRIEGWSTWNSVLFFGGTSGWLSRFSLWLGSSWLWGFSSAGDGARAPFLRRANPRKVTGPLPVSSECKSPAGVPKRSSPETPFLFVRAFMRQRQQRQQLERSKNKPW